MAFNFFKSKQTTTLDKQTPQVEISSTGVLSVSTKELLKNDSIKKQYELLKEPEYRKILQGK